MSPLASDVGLPVLILFCDSGPKSRHSARVSDALSDDTRPQLLQMTSPDSWSEIRLLLQLHAEHIVETSNTVMEHYLRLGGSAI